METIIGTPISPGAAIGKVYMIKDIPYALTRKKGKGPEEEKKRYQQARLEAAGQVEDLYQKLLSTKGEGEAAIFMAHKDILEDIDFISNVEAAIEELDCEAEWAVNAVQEQYSMIFQEMDQEYMRERAADIKDTAMRVIRILQGYREDKRFDIGEPVIVVSSELTPSVTAQLDTEYVKGILNETGGATSHAAIIARMLGIPFIIYPNITSLVTPGQLVAMDGENGSIELLVNDRILNNYKEKQAQTAEKEAKLKKLIGSKAVTRDGFEIKLAGNIGLPKDGRQILKKDGDSIGLFRTEFLFMDRVVLPSEEEQLEAYKETAEMMKGNPVIIRTLDIGGDKALDYLQIPKEENPFLGCRAIRFCLKRVSLWKTQLRALLRASAYGDVHIMFPMISALEELREAKQILEGVKTELREEGEHFNEDIPVGMMMETPAAAIMADQFAKEVDFFSIGTNDLIQYTMSVDRMNSEVSHLYAPYYPAVLHLIKHITESAHRHGIWVGICGESAADEKLLPVWIGLGMDELSMSSGSILPIRGCVQELEYVACKNLTDRILELTTAEEIKESLMLFPQPLPRIQSEEVRI